MVTLLREEHSVTVETATSFLLDASEWPYETPRLLNGIPVHIDFCGDVPPWADRFIYCLQVHFAGEKRWVQWEDSKRSQGFDMRRLTKRVAEHAADLQIAHKHREKLEQDRQLAVQHLTALGVAARVKQKDPLLLQEDNLRIEGIPERPNAVTVTLLTTHADAEKIAKEFRIFRQSRRKP